MATGAAPTRVHAWMPLRWKCGSPGTAFHSDPPSSTARLWSRTPRRGSFWPAWTVSQLVTEAGHPGLTPVCVSFWHSSTLRWDRSMLRHNCNNQKTKAAFAAEDFTTGTRPQPSAAGTSMQGTHPSLLPDVSPSVFKPMVSAQPLQSDSQEQQSPRWRHEGTGPLRAAPGKQPPHNGARQMV